MSNTVTINAITTDVVGHYGSAAKSLVAAYRTASERALAASGGRYARLVERLPLVGDEGKARMVAAERRVAQVVGEGVARIADGYDRGIEVVSGQLVKGLEAIAERTAWTKDMFVVETARRIQMPAAKLSLEIASRIDEAASTLSARAEGTKPVAKAVKQPVKRARRAAKRVRRAA
nr:hypothetical protein [Caldimonas sp.]